MVQGLGGADRAIIGNKGTYFFGAAENSREINPAIYHTGRIDGRQYAGPAPVSRISARSAITNPATTPITIAAVLNLEKRFGNGLSVLANYTFSKKIDDLRLDESVQPRLRLRACRARTCRTTSSSRTCGRSRTSTSAAPRALFERLDGELDRDLAKRISVLGDQRPGQLVHRRRTATAPISWAARRPGFRAARTARWWRSTSTPRSSWRTRSGRSATPERAFCGAQRSSIRTSGLLKNTNIKEQRRLQFRAEFFNMFNNVNFNAPTSNVASAQFGRITSALDPRIVQFGVKLLF